MLANEYLTVPDAAREMGISPRTLDRLLNEKKIACVRVRVHRRISRTAIAAFLAERAGGPVAQVRPIREWALGD